MHATTASFLAGAACRPFPSKVSANAALLRTSSSMRPMRRAILAVAASRVGGVRSRQPFREEQAMVARVTSVRVNPEDVEDSIRLFDESVIPAAEQEEGFQGVLLLVRDDGHALAIDLCDSIEHVRANERSGVYQTQVTKFADKIVETPKRQVYRVAVAKGLKGGRELLLRS